MNARTRKVFLWHSKRKEYKERLNHAKKVIDECYTHFKSPYVAYSGGKDSIVLSHIILSMYPEAEIWHWDYGDDLMPRAFEKEVIENLKSYGAKNITIDKRRGKGRDTSYGYRQFFQQIENNMKKYDWDIGIVGVRQQESITRKNKYTKHFMNNTCYPLLKLTVEDVWTYIISHNLKYPKSYDLQGDYVGWDKIRFVTFFDPEFETMESHQNIFLGEYR
jgi:3'-phosphoadenosine 5'-phosphosulfate sulfotransferase (PAPS reductase)/FAD synthetase